MDFDSELIYRMSTQPPKASTLAEKLYTWCPFHDIHGKLKIGSLVHINP